jgi:hypothetical protein
MDSLSQMVLGAAATAAIVPSAVKKKQTTQTNISASLTVWG